MRKHPWNTQALTPVASGNSHRFGEGQRKQMKPYHSAVTQQRRHESRQKVFRPLLISGVGPPLWPFAATNTTIQTGKTINGKCKSSITSDDLAKLMFNKPCLEVNAASTDAHHVKPIEVVQVTVLPLSMLRVLVHGDLGPVEYWRLVHVIPYIQVLHRALQRTVAQKTGSSKYSTYATIKCIMVPWLNY